MNGADGKFYFVSYRWSRIPPYASREGFGFSEKVIANQHPVDFLIDLRTEHGRADDKGFLVGMEYALLFYAEITEAQYCAWDGHVG